MTVTKSSKCLKDPFKYQIEQLNKANNNANYECSCSTNKTGIANFVFDSKGIRMINKYNQSVEEEIYPSMEDINITWNKEYRYTE